MPCKYIINNGGIGGTSYCMLAEDSAKQLLEIEKMIDKWIPILEKPAKESGLLANILEDFKQIKRK